MRQEPLPAAGRWAVVLLCLLGAAAVGATPGAATTPAVTAPTAAIGAFDCARLSVPLHLDNTRSTRAATFGHSGAFRSPLHRPYRGTDARVDVEVAAGASVVVVLPVRDDARTDVTVHLPDGGHVLSQGSCGDAPGATFGLARCNTMRLPVTLDNSTSSRPVRYRWAVADPVGPLVSRSVEVDAGDVVGVDVPLVPDGWTDVAVTLEGAGPVASSDRQTCGRIVLDPRASFGVVDCTDVSAPVLLDNSRTTTRVRFTLPGQAVVVGARETRSLRVRLPVRERVAVTVDDVLSGGKPTERAVTSTARCAAAAASPGDAGAAEREEAAAGAAAARVEAAAGAAGAAATPQPGATDAGASGDLAAADLAAADLAAADLAAADLAAADLVAGGPAAGLVVGATVLLLSVGLGLFVTRRRAARAG